MKLTAKQKLQKKIDLIVEGVLNEASTIKKTFYLVADDSSPIPDKKQLILIDTHGSYCVGYYKSKTDTFDIGFSYGQYTNVDRSNIKYYAV